MFEETYPQYPDEPLLNLIKSGVFIDKDGYKYNAENCIYKLALFVLMASKADSKDLLECWSQDFSRHNDVRRDKATSMIRRMFEICIDILK